MGSAAALSLAGGLDGRCLASCSALALVLAWNAAIYLDSSALTAGTVQAADPALRGATMGLHSMLGYAGGFLGPLASAWCWMPAATARWAGASASATSRC